MKSIKLIFTTFFVAMFMSFTYAQNGNIQGTIADENGIYVPGATVLIQDLNKGVISDNDGKFTFVSVPAGTHQLLIKYLGFADFQKEITVSPNQTASITIILAAESLELDGVEVSAFGLSGQSRALNTQKNNTNITNVVSTDQIGKFPDANIGDAVKRIPGITMQVDQGEARNIIVRGLSPQLNSVTLNGSRIPSAEGDNRNIQMDLIPSDMIQTIEVNKAVTPDMDGDALGGSVNLITRTAPQGFRVSATAGSGINFITNKRILNGSFLVGDRTDDGKFGWMLGASVNDNDFGSDNVEAEWTDEFEYNTGQQDADGEDILEELDVNPYNNVFEQRTYLVQRIRRSFSANLDYKLDDNNSIYLKTMYNWRDDRENRLAYSNEILDAEDIGVNDFTIDTNNNLIGFPVEAKRETKGGISGGRNDNARLEDQRMQNYSLGGEHLFGSLKFDWMTSYAKASEERKNERYIVYENEFLINRNIDTKKPLYLPQNNDDAALSNYEFDELTEEYQYTEEEDINAFLNFELPADFFGNGDGSIKFGGRTRLKNKFRDNNFFEYTPLFNEYETMDLVPTRDYSDSDFLAGSQYQAGSFVTPEFLGGLNLKDGTQFEEESVPDEFLRGNFDVDEDVYAGYVMATQKLTPKLTLLAGVRIENTQITARGNEILDEEDLIGEIVDESSYTNVLPGVHFKYNFSDKTILRLAWTNTLARPNYVDLVPYVDVVTEDEELYLGNADLDPTTSMNFDIMAEHYFQSVGIVSGGVFYKNIDKFIYTSRFEVQDDFYGNGTAGFEVFQPQNGDNASVLGAEVSFQRQLDFLPGFAKNFNIYLNYTYLTSDAEGIRNEDGEERDDLDLPNTAPNMFNGSFGYADDRFSIRFSANYSDAYIDEIGGNAFEDRYYDEQFFLDFNASFAITNNLRVYAELNNITNQPLRYYQGQKDRTMQMEYYEKRLTFGLKYDLFRK
ncbi:TonB-dependent receptor [Galbibacter mesophilus]|uniref:TonB-dependent receptor n=1 Tax=Galbibacter mesophilus TaxID=379069 RepID=UPI00191EBF67|nr:TonB-dependent receptor [Galbibacter mesophilus]MCM5661887.1 TonB-dependent receptor [Galbibacter mesophilus]